MRKHCKHLLLAAALLMTGTAQAQTQLNEYRPGVTPEGAVYFLPKTALRISVLVEKSTYEPGDFAVYAQRYLRVAGVSQEPSTTYRVVGIAQTAVPVPDTTKVYAVHYDAHTVASRLTLSEDGRLLGINVDDACDATPPATFEPATQPAWVNPRQLMSEEILSCGSTAKMAELTAHEIYDLRENRSLLIKGQADFMPHDGRQMQIMLDELDRHDRALTSLFLGITKRDTTEHILWVAPEQLAAQHDELPTWMQDEPANQHVLFRLSQLHGFTDADDLSGAPYYIAVSNITQLPAKEEGGKKKSILPWSKKSVNGIYVNVPGRLRSTIYEGITPLLTDELVAPQFGYTELLSGNLFNKHYTTKVWIDPVSGAFLRLDGDQPK
jgi:hypothetical protein